MSKMGEVLRPNVKTQMFKNLDAALDYCRFVDPEQLTITRVYSSEMRDSPAGYQLAYTGSEGML